MNLRALADHHFAKWLATRMHTTRPALFEAGLFPRSWQDRQQQQLRPIARLRAIRIKPNDYLRLYIRRARAHTAGASFLLSQYFDERVECLECCGERSVILQAYNTGDCLSG